MMQELRRLKRVMDFLGIKIKVEWLSSALNHYADGFSRRLSRRDLQIEQGLRLSVLAGLRAPCDAFPCLALGESPLLVRRQILEDLARVWTAHETLVLCSLPDLISAILRHYARRAQQQC